MKYFRLKIPFVSFSGIAIAAAVRTGHNLGAQLPNQARVSAWVAVWFAFSVSLVNGTIFVSLRYVYPRWFTDDEDVIELVEQLVPVVVSVQFLMVHLRFLLVARSGSAINLLIIVDFSSQKSSGIVFSGILNGCGKQKFVALINILSYYLVGLPFGVWLAFYNDFGLEGIWWGVLSSNALKFLGELIIVHGMDWDLECKIALDRLQGQDGGTSALESIDEIDDV